MAILLGSVLLDGFEAAAEIRFGGSQSLAIHKLPGGMRVIDAMGADDDVIAWHGILSGYDAAPRARTLDAMRSAGTPVSILWDAFSAQVILSDLSLIFQNSWWIPYRIRCTVLTRPAASAAAPNVPSALSDILNDLTGVTGPGVPAAFAAVSAPGASVAGGQAYATAQTALSAANAGLALAMTGANAAVLNAFDIPTLLSATGSLAMLANAAGFVGRANANFNGALD